MRTASSRSVLITALSVGVMLSISAPEAYAQNPQRTDKLSVPKGAKAQVKGNTARISGGGSGGPGLSGTWNCVCDVPGVGTCMVSQLPTGLTCGSGAGAGGCSTKCLFIAWTTGVTPPARSGDGPSGPKGSPGKTPTPGRSN
jgi:hypothetical protein